MRCKYLLSQAKCNAAFSGLDLAWFQGPGGGGELAAVLWAIPPFVEGTPVSLLRRVTQHSPAPQEDSNLLGMFRNVQITEPFCWGGCSVSFAIFNCFFDVEVSCLDMCNFCVWIKLLLCNMSISLCLVENSFNYTISLQVWTQHPHCVLFWKWWHTQLIDKQWYTLFPISCLIQNRAYLAPNASFWLSLSIL